MPTYVTAEFGNDPANIAILGGDARRERTGDYSVPHSTSPAIPIRRAARRLAGCSRPRDLREGRRGARHAREHNDNIGAANVP